MSPYKNNDTSNYDNDQVTVTALKPFFQRRLISIPGIDKKQYRALQAGEKVKINAKAFDKFLYKKEG